MLVVLAVHLLAAGIAVPLVRRFGRRAFLALATVPASAAVWAAVQAPAALSADPPTQVVSWVPELGLSLTSRLDALSLLMVVLVGGIGALVFAYCAWYFDEGERGLGAFAVLLTGFAAAMLVVVTADDLLLLYVGWELTTVFSWLLVGHTPTDRRARRAAMQALLITSAGGLAMLLGFLILGHAAGTYRISALLADPPSGTPLTVGAVLVLAGAFTKSAQVPFHSWLPRAMAAPTPVSAYLHSAAMVKAGIYLLARFSPALAAAGPWRPLVVAVGLSSMVLGGWRALRQYDLKLLLAYGTASQLGFLTVLAGSGTPEAGAAAAAMLGAHALFKGSLFLTAGVLDHTAGTRDIRHLSGLWRRHRVLLVTAVLACASMAAVPPLAGFVGKEAAYSVYLHGGPGGVVTLTGLVAGSVLTVAYSVRFVGGAFGPPQTELDRLAAAAGNAPGLGVAAVREARSTAIAMPTATHPVAAGFAAPGLLLAVAGLVLGLAPALAEPLVAAVARLAGPEPVEHLALWHGMNTALGLSALTLGAGALLVALRRPVGRVQALLHARLPTGLDADSGYRRAVTAVDRFARAVTGRTQVGSLPVYLAITLLTFAAAPAIALAIGTTPVHARLWDTPTQALIGGIVLIAAATATRAHRRFTAVLLTGAVGYGVALLYLVQGAPDLALTQLLVETVTLVAFVLVLRTLPRTFARRAARPVPVAGRMPPAGRTPVLARVPVLGRLHRFGIRRPVRLAVSAAVGITTAMLVLAAAGSRTADPVGPAYLPVAYPDGGGRNVVNVLLTDFRAMDTFGEISVIAIAAVGILSLVAAGRPATAAAPRAATTGGSRRRAGSAATFRPPESGMAGTRRYVVLEVAGRLLFHTIAVFSVYLLLAGHNLPGGGFAGGLVLGLALALRYLAGGSRDLLDVAPVPPAVVLGSGLALAALAGAGAWVFGGQFLQSAILERDVPVLGHVKVVTVVVFDTGVYLVVVGMVLAVLRGLGVEIARRTAQRESEAAERAGTS